jgi:DNA polymerase-4
MGAEETFARDIDDPEVVLREFLRLSHKVAARLRSHGSVGRTVAIKVRMADFSTLTRSRTLPEPTDVAHEIYDVAAELYDALGLQRVRIRLVGVRLEGLIQADGGERQLTFDVPGDAPATLDWRATEQAADRLRARYGHSVVQPARLVDPGPGD